MASIDLPDSPDAILASLEDVRDVSPITPRVIEPTLRERMRIHSQMPELDDIFVSSLDFPGQVVRPGQYHERSFSFGRECRVTGIRIPRGLTVARIVMRLGPEFRVIDSPVGWKSTADRIPDSPIRLHSYEGADARVYEGSEAVKGGEWKQHRLVPENRGSLYLLVRNDTRDDLRFEGTLLFAEDRVPEPEHETL